jgi:hypothetical protein
MAAAAAGGGGGAPVHGQSFRGCDKQHMLAMSKGDALAARACVTGLSTVSRHDCLLEAPHCLTCCFSCSSLLFPIDGFLVGLL